jgi:hypothetical protein
LATVAAIAVADAPGWQTHLQDPPLKAGIDRLNHYLQTERPPHDLRGFRAEFDRILGRLEKAGMATDWPSFTAPSDSLCETLGRSKTPTDILASDMAGKRRIADELDHSLSLLPSPVIATGV